MSNFQFQDGALPGLKIIQPFYSKDNRGEFVKTFERSIFQQAGISMAPAEEFFSVSRRGAIRGLHFQRQHMQDKLIRVLNGTAYDVVVDLRRDSPSFGKWEGYSLTSENRRMLYLPKGFAHGFLALEDGTLLSYLCGDSFDPETDGGIRWDDPELGIDWPLPESLNVTISEKDLRLPSFSEFRQTFGYL